jgi:hypothetical protein
MADSRERKDAEESGTQGIRRKAKQVGMSCGKWGGLMSS